LIDEVGGAGADDVADCGRGFIDQAVEPGGDARPAVGSTEADAAQGAGPAVDSAEADTAQGAPHGAPNGVTAAPARNPATRRPDLVEQSLHGLAAPADRRGGLATGSRSRAVAVGAAGACWVRWRLRFGETGCAARVAGITSLGIVLLCLCSHWRSPATSVCLV